MRVLVVGCGYVGAALGAELERHGHNVFGIRRSSEAGKQPATAGVQMIQADITKPDDLQRVQPAFDWVINTAASSGGDAEAYRALYWRGTQNLLRWLAGTRVRKYIYTSSTSVYGQTDGSWVTEQSATEPDSPTSQVLIETERLLLAANEQMNFPSVILRVAGIYGPDRGYWLRQFLSGEAVIEGAGERILNMVHRDDVVRALAAALERGAAGQIYNVCDDEPVTQRELFEWLSHQLGRPMPPAEAAGAGPRKRGITNKRISNAKLRLELGCELKYPTFRQGYAAEIARLEVAGLLARRS